MDPHVDAVRTLFDDWASTGRGERMAASHSKAARAAFERLELGPFSRYLDVGCGVGYTVRWAASVDPTVVALGIDASGEMVDRARDQTPVNTRFIHAPFPLPMLRGESFDAVFTMETLYYLPDVAAGLAEIARLLKPGGRVAIVVDFYAENEASHVWPEELGLEMTLWSEAQWVEALGVAGLDEVVAERFLAPLRGQEEPGWKQTVGSLMLFARKPSTSP